MTDPDRSQVTGLPVPTSAPDAPSLMVMMGGTFDPPHIGHVQLPLRARDELERRAGAEANSRAWLVYVPAARSPHKPDAPVVSDEDRVEMLRLATAGVPRCAVWTDEVDRARASGSPAQASFTIETLERARGWLDERGLAGCPIRLLIGADQAGAFHRWHRPRDILRLAKPAVMMRVESHEPGPIGVLMSTLMRAEFWDRRELAMWEESIVPIGTITVSASEIRRRLARGDSGYAGRMLAPAVLQFILNRRLYASDRGAAGS